MMFHNSDNRCRAGRSLTGLLVLAVLAAWTISCQNASDATDGTLPIGNAGDVRPSGAGLTKADVLDYLSVSGALTASFPVMPDDPYADSPGLGGIFLNPGNYAIDWNKCQSSVTAQGEEFYAAIRPTYFHAAIDSGGTVLRRVPVVQRLKLSRCRATGLLSLTYESVIPTVESYSRHRIHQGSGYINKQRRFFSATVIEQDTSGRVVSVLRYGNGELLDTLFLSRPAPSGQTRANPYTCLRGFSWWSAQCPVTRSGGEYGDIYCSICGRPIDDCVCTETGNTYCPGCGNTLEECTCGNSGGDAPDFRIFPSCDEIYQDTGVRTEMERAWSLMLEHCTESGRYEYGFLIYYDFSDGTLHCGSMIEGGFTVNSSQSTIRLSGPYTLDGAELCATFHVHTSYQYVASHMRRSTGPSNADRSSAEQNSMPGLLYDYSAPRIYPGDSKYNAYQLYTCGPERRPSN